MANGLISATALRVGQLRSEPAPRLAKGKSRSGRASQLYLGHSAHAWWAECLALEFTET